MKRLIGFAACVLLCAGVAAAQSNPVVDSVRNTATHQERNLKGAVQEMPAGKYSFKPTSGQMSFGQLVLHIANSNFFACSKLAGGAPPQGPKLTATSPKDQLVDALNRSFDYCNQALGNLQDSQLGDAITLYGNRKGTKADALIGLTNDWADHYSQAASYLRLNGMLPPSAQRRRPM